VRKAGCRWTAGGGRQGGGWGGGGGRGAGGAVAGVSWKVKIGPGIDIDIPTGPNEKKTTPDDVYAAGRAAFDGGAHGVLLSRKYSEMPLANLRAAGRAVRDLNVG